MIRAGIVCVLLGGLVACAGLPEPDEADTTRIEARIVSVCTAGTLFRPFVRGAITIAVPVGALPLAMLDAGVDRVCAEPARFAQDVGTLEWLAKNLAADQIGSNSPP